MVNMFEMSDMCDKHFNEGKYAKIEKKNIVKKDPEEVVHIEENEEQEETEVGTEVPEETIETEEN